MLIAFVGGLLATYIGLAAVFAVLVALVGASCQSFFDM
jgi:hypothetical protein